MGDILPFKRPPTKNKSAGTTLCKSGFHKWAVDQTKQFDVKEGKLVTISRCTRCGVTKTTLD